MPYLFIVFPVCLRAGIHCFLSFYRLPRGLSRQPHTGMTIVNESGDDGEGKGQNQDLDPGSRTYRDDDEVGHTGMTGILNLRGLWPQFSAMRSEQIHQRRMSRIPRRILSPPALTTACLRLPIARRRCPSRQFHNCSFETTSICLALIHSPLAFPSISAGSSARAFFITSRYSSLSSRKG